MSDCGCRVRPLPSSRNITNYIIDHCPLHKAAGQMREALKELCWQCPRCDDWHRIGCEHLNVMKDEHREWQEVYCDPACRAAREALKAAGTEE